MSKQASEENVWNGYLNYMDKAFSNGLSKQAGAIPINQANHAGANIVKSRATQVAMAQTILASKRGGKNGKGVPEVDKLLKNI